MSHGHQKSDLRNQRLHEAALEKLRLQPELKAAVLALLDRWLVQEELSSSRAWLQQWREMLTSWPFEKLQEAVLDEVGGQSLRQCSPLAPVLTPRERWAILREVERKYKRDVLAAS